MDRAEPSLRSATAEDLAWIAELLDSALLPTAGISDHLSGFLVAEVQSRPVGCAAIERYGSEALLRSVAVVPGHRGLGIGRRLVEALISRAAADGIRTLILLTTTSARYFSRLGFREVDRALLPESVGQSEELRGACPASAAILRLDL
jgi:amino-acid N-acetyltransferase